MKKQLLLIVFMALVATTQSQDTITGWTFPVNHGSDSLNANLGLSTNLGYDLRFQLVLTPTSDSTINSIVFVDGPETYAAATAGWQDGENVRFWSIKFKANNYSNFKVSSKQRSTDGPRDFKLQWRLSSTTFEDIAGGVVTVADNWTTGVVNQLAVPITGQGTSSCYIRWLMASNTNVNGETVAPGGVSMIDDILVTATSSLGVDEIVYSDRISLYPSPNQGSFTVASTQPVEKLYICDESGKTVFAADQPGMSCKVNLPGIARGNYILRVRFNDTDKELTRKFIVK